MRCGLQADAVHGGWTESVPYSFTGGNDGGTPYSGVILDSAGDLYGTAYYGGADSAGTVYELSPSGSGWTEKTLTDFAGGGGFPFGGLTFDPKGNLYGTGIRRGHGLRTVSPQTAAGFTTCFTPLMDLTGRLAARLSMQPEMSTARTRPAAPMTRALFSN